MLASVCNAVAFALLLTGRIMTWRKKWEKDWADVKYCSDKCRHAAKRSGGGIGGACAVDDAADGTACREH